MGGRDCCKGINCERDVEFWADALGPQTVREAEDLRYVDLTGDVSGTGVLLQTINHSSRVHRDIETDDCLAAVARLEALGAKQIAHIRVWTVTEAPN